MNMVLPFPPSPKARADLKPGTLYAIDGGDSYLYYGQVAPNKQIGFFKFRSREVLTQEALAAPLMSRFGANYPLIGTALRVGKWLNLGRQARPLNLAPFGRWTLRAKAAQRL
jgi:hypothetical protein